MSDLPVGASSPNTVPTLIMESLLVPAEGYLQMILWQDVSGLDFEVSPIDLIILSEMSG